MQDTPKHTPSERLLADYREAHTKLQLQVRDVSAWIALFSGHRTGHIWAALEHTCEHFEAINKPNTKRMVAESLLSVRVDRISPEMTSLWLDALEIATTHLGGDDLNVLRAPHHDSPLLMARHRVVRLLMDPSITLAQLSEAPRNDIHDMLARLKPDHLNDRDELLNTLREHFADDAIARHILLVFCVKSVEARTLPLAEGTELLQEDLQTEHDSLRIAALQALSTPWAIFATHASHAFILKVRAMAASSNRGVMKAAIDWLEHARALNALELLLKDPRTTLDTYAHTIAAMATCADASHIQDFISITQAHPSELAPYLFPTLLTLHHRGEYIAPEHIPALINLFEQTRTCPVDEWQAITYTAREHVLAELSAKPQTDEAWAHTITLLDGLEGSDELVATLITNLERPTLLRALAQIARQRSSTALEQALLERCASHPGIMLSALVTCGTSQTHDYLLEALGGPDADTPPADWVYPHHTLITSLVWQLAEEDARQQMLTHLRPEALPRVITQALGSAPDDHHVGMLITRATHHLDEDPQAHTLATFITLCRHASPRHMPLVRHLFAALVFTMDSILENEESYGRTFIQEVTLSEEIQEAIEDLSARWHAQGAMRPACIALANSATQAHTRLLNALLLGTLTEHADALEPHHRRILLDAIAMPLQTADLQILKPMMWIDDPHVRKVLIRTFAQSDDPGIITWFHGLITGHDDIETLRQAIIALQEHGAPWASITVARGLEHENMNIKLATARALIEIGDVRIVPRLMFWLGHHDHETLRHALKHALVRILGDGWMAAVKASLSQEEDDRRRMLLSQLIDDDRTSKTAYSTGDAQNPLEDPVSWWRSMNLLKPIHRAERFPELFDMTMPSELALWHLDDVLSWCTHETMTIHRAPALRWVTRHVAHASRARRMTLVEALRAVPYLMSGEGFERLDALNALNALLTFEDQQQIISDARRSSEPVERVRETLTRLTKIEPQLSTKPEVLELVHHILDAENSDSNVLDTFFLSKKRPLHAHLITMFPDLRADRALRALAFLMRDPRAHAHTTKLDFPSPLESSTDLLDILVDDERPHVSARALSKLLSRHLTPDLERIVLMMTLEKPLPRGVSTSELAKLLSNHLHIIIHAVTSHDDLEMLGRLIQIAGHLSIVERIETLDTWLELWQRDDLPEETHLHLDRLIGTLPSMRLLEELLPHIEEGHLGFASLLRGNFVESPMTQRLLKAFSLHGAANREDLITSLLDRTTPFVYATPPEQEELEDTIMSHELSPHAARQSGTSPRARNLSEEDSGGMSHDAALEVLARHASEIDTLEALRILRHSSDDRYVADGVLESLRTHRSLRVRSTAWRTLRAIGARSHYLTASMFLTNDPRIEVQRSAILALAHAHHEPAISRFITLHARGGSGLREEVAEALVVMGEPARRSIIKSLPHIRPDRRPALEDLLVRMESTDEEL